MPKSKKRKLTAQQELLGIHLKELGLTHEFEYQFLPDRKFRFDVYMPPIPVKNEASGTWEHKGIGIEIDGFHNGRHGAGWGSDHEKDRLAQVHGFWCLRFTNKEVESGAAKDFIAKYVL